MSTATTIAILVVALLGFWAVGAYNRLVRLRTAIGSAFAALEVQIRQQHELLRAWTEILHPLLDDSPQPVDSVVVAAGQLLQATEQARLRPSSQPAIASLQAAEQSLAEARGKLLGDLPVHLVQPSLSDARMDLVGLGDQIAATDSTLAFARQQFNGAVDKYNHARTQFPTTLIIGVLGFEAAGNL